MPKVTEHVHERLNKDLNPNPKCQAANPTFFTAEAHGKVSDTEQAGMTDTSLGHLSKGGCQIFVVACTGCSVGAEGPPNTQEAKEQTVVLFYVASGIKLCLSIRPGYLLHSEKHPFLFA